MTGVQDRMGKEKKKRYCILYILEAEQQKLVNTLRRHIPEERGEIFYPCMEYYRRDLKRVVTKSIFPEYVFLYTDLNAKEVHNIIREHRAEIHSGMRELALANVWMTDEDFLLSNETEDTIYDLSDVKEEETEYLDCLRMGNGLLTMSSGYEYQAYEDVKEDTGKTRADSKKGKKNKRGKNKKKPVKKWTVMEGPLKVYESKIVKVDKHERLAYLKFEFNGNQARAGFNCLPKAHWFPDEDVNIGRLPDGKEFDIDDLKRSIMTVSK